MQDPGRLLGVGVLVTRPEQQAGPLCRLFEREGAFVLPWPVLDIVPAADFAQTVQRIGRTASFDLIVFTSANAVRFGAALVNDAAPIAAIGPATARALEQLGLAVSVLPGAGFDSESLLRQPALGNVSGKKVLLVKGAHGRDLLRQQLSQRGAQITTVEVYRRERKSHGAGELAELAARFAGGQLKLITATSAEIGCALLDLATPELRRQIEAACWLVPGARIVAGLRERGLAAAVAQADSAEDHDLVAAAVRWRSTASGA